ncbi:UDP-glucose dehydrogenase family protein [Nocardia niigatensis]
MPHTPPTSRHDVVLGDFPALPDAGARVVAVIGCGYVGLTTAVCLASLGPTVRCVDTDTSLIDGLRRGRSSLREPGLTELLQAGLSSATLMFTTTLASAVADANVVFVCVPTPSQPDSPRPDLSAVQAALFAMRSELVSGAIVVIKSTVPIGTCRWAQQTLGREDVQVAANPEFLREGHAIGDFLQPARIVIGAADPVAAKAVAALYSPIGAEIVLTTAETAEAAKYAANGFLALRLSFVNALAELCGYAGAEIEDLLQILGSDPRIGTQYLQPGPGWGGPCLPKDARALVEQAHHHGIDFGVLQAAIEANTRHRRLCVECLTRIFDGRLTGRQIALFGLAFKAATTDLRDSVAISIAAELAAAGASVTGNDPLITDTDLAELPTKASPYDAAAGADAVVVLNDDPLYAALDWCRIASAMTGCVVIDSRHCLPRAQLEVAGLTWMSLFAPLTREEADQGSTGFVHGHSVEHPRPTAG